MRSRRSSGARWREGEHPHAVLGGCAACARLAPSGIGFADARGRGGRCSRLKNPLVSLAHFRPPSMNARPSHVRTRDAQAAYTERGAALGAASGQQARRALSPASRRAGSTATFVRGTSQHPIDCFIVDFASIAHRLVVEVDGAIHADAERVRRDAARQRALEALGWRVLRLSPDFVYQQYWVPELQRLASEPHGKSTAASTSASSVAAV